MAEKRACEKCGRVFSVPPAFLKRNNHHYCSRACFKTHERDPNVRFWRYVTRGQEVDCWPWEGGRSTDGYGTFSYCVRGPDGLATGRVSTRAHRYSWEHHRGAIPDGQSVLHTCDNRACVNPAHLFLGTLIDNMRDRNTKGRQAKHNRQGRAKLTMHLATQIRAARAAGMTQVQLSEMHGVGRTTIRALLSGRTWRP